MLPLGVIMTIAHHLGTEVTHVGKLARARRDLLAVLLPGILLYRNALNTRDREIPFKARSSGVGAGSSGGSVRAEGGDWREIGSLVTTGVGAGVSAVKQVRDDLSHVVHIHVGCALVPHRAAQLK